MRVIFRFAWTTVRISVLLLAVAVATSTAQDCGRNAPCNAASQQSRTVYFDRSTYGTIQSCIDAAGENGTCILRASSAVTLTYPSNLNIRTTGTTLRCEPGAVIQQGHGFRSAHLILVTGSNVTISGCTLRGDPSAENSALVNVEGAAGASLTNNVLENIATNNFGLYVAKGATDFRIEGNTLTAGIAGRPIFVISNVKDTRVQRGQIRGNTITTTGGNSEDDILLLTNSPTATMSDLEVTDNVMVAGPDSCAKGGCFCVEIGGFGGLGPTDVTVKGNT